VKERRPRNRVRRNVFQERPDDRAALEGRLGREAVGGPGGENGGQELESFAAAEFLGHTGRILRPPNHSPRSGVWLTDTGCMNSRSVWLAAS